jgi:hypothetical protein
MMTNRGTGVPPVQRHGQDAHATVSAAAKKKFDSLFKI